jgi:hypothetical protein
MTLLTLPFWLRSILLAGTCSVVFAADPTEPAPLSESVPSVPSVPETETPAPAAETTPVAGDEAPAPNETAGTELPSRDSGDPRGDPRNRADSRSFDRFQLIVERNIFDSERQKRVVNREPPPPRIERPRVQTISLNGTIRYDGKAFAFMNSSESEYRGVFSLGDILGDWRLAAIDTRGVKLETDDIELDLPVGKSLRREGEQAWEVSDEFTGAVTSGRFASSNNERRGPDGSGGTRSSGGPSFGSPGGSDVAAAAAGNAGGGSGDDAMSEIMRRMMERRKQELSE